MFKKLIALTITLMLVSSAMYADKLDDIINGYVKARGIDKMKDVKTLKYVGKISVMGMEIKFTNYINKPDKLRYESDMMGQKSIQIINGDKGWNVTASDTTDLPKETFGQLQQLNDFLEGPLVNYKEKGTNLKLTGKETVEGAEAYKLHVTSKEGEEADVFIATKDYHLIKMVAKDPQGGEVTIRMKNNKVIAGIEFPHEIEISIAAMNQKQSIIFESIEVNSAMPDSLFKIK
jgi:outer membrane lipoprotein-sorting protein